MSNHHRRGRTALNAAAVAAALLVAAGLAGTVARADQETGQVAQSQANRLSIFHDYDLDALGRPSVDHTDEDVPGVAGGGAFADLLGTLASTDPNAAQRAFSVTAAPVVGYDSNPEARRVARGSIFGGGDVTAAFHLSRGPGDPIVGHPTEFGVSYDVVGAAYEGQVQNADTLQQTFAATVRQSLFNDTVYVSAAVDDQFTMEHGAAFLNTTDVAPSVEAFLLPQASVEVGSDYTHLQYLFYASTLKDKPTAERNTLYVKAHLFPLPQVRNAVVPEAPDQLTDILRGGLRRFTVGYGHVWNNPYRTGNDYDYEANRVFAGLDGLSSPRLRDLSMDVEYAHEFQNYLNPNSEGVSPTALPRRRRRDNLDVFTVRANARLFDLPRDRGTLATFLQYDLIHDGATIVPRRFNEFTVSGGLTYRY